MLSLDTVTNYDLLSRDERLLFLEKATELLKKEKLIKPYACAKRFRYRPLWCAI